LDNLQISKESFPFDWIPTQPHLVIKYIQNKSISLPDTPCKDRNEDNVWFGHFDLNPESRQELEDKFVRRFQRFFDRLNSGDKILLFYTSEADVYNEMGSLINKGLNYINVKNLVKILQQQFPSSNFDVLYINTNDERPNERIGRTTIYNLTVYVDSKYISLNMETHVDYVIDPYRRLVELAFKILFFGKKQEYQIELEEIAKSSP
jgi:hypothetical protein